eukprot:2938329-Rhodomonas_salina.1
MSTRIPASITALSASIRGVSLAWIDPMKTTSPPTSAGGCCVGRRDGPRLPISTVPSLTKWTLPPSSAHKCSRPSSLRKAAVLCRIASSNHARRVA